MDGNSLESTCIFSSRHTVPYAINLCVVMQVRSAATDVGNAREKAPSSEVIASFSLTSHSSGNRMKAAYGQVSV
jgi:hypothetical protein